MKSRLCIMGNQEDASKFQMYSPTVSKEMALLSWNVMARKDWTVYTIDVKQAFLQSDELMKCSCCLSKRRVWETRQRGN